MIGWLYQFYISDKKDDVIGKVVKSEDIPAATQLFYSELDCAISGAELSRAPTGCIYPDSGTAPRYAMPLFFPVSKLLKCRMNMLASRPIALSLKASVCLMPWLGHILIEAYNLLYRIYEERGYRSREIPQLILTHNIFGFDIDDRAAGWLVLR